MNTYSSSWNEIFLKNKDQTETQKEVDLLVEVFPREQFPKVIDLCCGLGRHAISLAKEGYDVTAIDKNPEIIKQAEEMANSQEAQVNFICDDVMNVSPELGEFDLCIIMWQSFGYFSDEQNLELLKKINSILRPGGSLFLDVYNSQFMENQVGEKSFDVGGLEVTQTTTLEGGRIKINLSYSNGEKDQFDWQIFSPDELDEFTNEAGFQSVRTFEGFQDSTIEGVKPRMQVSFFSF